MMTVIITLFALPIGLWMIFNERKSHQHYQAVFDDFFELMQKSDLDLENKAAKLRAMLEYNRYHITHLNKNIIKAEKKLFSTGWLTLGLGFAYLGAVIYIVYFYKFQKPHIVEFHLK